MRRALSAAMGAAIAVMASQAQAETMQWTQKLSVPKGQNLPKGVKADILGIEIGDTYAEIKPKLDALVKEVAAPQAPQTDMQRYSAEAMGNADTRPLIEDSTSIRVQTPGGYLETAGYIGQIRMKRDLPGKSRVTISEETTIRLSAPASGNQVLGLQRHLYYRTPEDQPRASEIMARLKEKFKADPQDHSFGKTLLYRFQFDNGQAVYPQKSDINSCPPEFTIGESSGIPAINRLGNCDVVFVVRIYAGMTMDHAERIEFTLSDNERTKANKTADFEFIGAYVNDMQGKAKGVAPKL